MRPKEHKFQRYAERAFGRPRAGVIYLTVIAAWRPDSNSAVYFGLSRESPNLYCKVRPCRKLQDALLPRMTPKP